MSSYWITKRMLKVRNYLFIFILAILNNVNANDVTKKCWPKSDGGIMCISEASVQQGASNEPSAGSVNDLPEDEKEMMQKF